MIRYFLLLVGFDLEVNHARYKDRFHKQLTSGSVRDLSTLRNIDGKERNGCKSGLQFEVYQMYKRHVDGVDTSK